MNLPAALVVRGVVVASVAAVWWVALTRRAVVPAVVPTFVAIVLLILHERCRDEGIDPRKPERLPLLFALDSMLAIPGGYRYVADCSLPGADRGSTHCAAGFGCGSSCASGSDGDGSDGAGGCGSGCGGGD